MPAPTRRVHFEDDVPSPSFSESSLASSSGPYTPPQYGQHLAPHPKSYVPASPLPFGLLPYVGGQVSIHPVLAAPMFGYAPAFAWNMMFPPSTARPTSAGSLMSPASVRGLLAEYATHPALPELTIICDLLPWSITVAPTESASWSPSSRRLVTVGDVLHAIYRALRLPASSVEVGHLQYENRGRVDAAFFSRCGSISDPDQTIELSKGVKRVDFLMEHRGFSGLFS
ncbi:hypothetical protein B0H21DRAFT_98191 [Amylocystis lapponica]|nr:hypothetical protein B0H21DRAFT_98191 [Amylocystis lapponica]